MINKIKHLLKQYFVFNKKEQTGIFAILILIVITTLIPKLIWVFSPVKTADFSVEVLASDSVIDFALADTTSDMFKPTHRTVFNFNPNKIVLPDLLLLGFSKNTANRIVNFRNKGGRFYKPDDLFKIYGVDSDLVTQLLPFVLIDSGFTKQPFNKSEINAYKPTPTVEINLADSAALVKLYGIGPVLAARIALYKERLGGFLHLQQLKEVYGVDDDLLKELEGKITVDPTLITYLKINDVDYETLKQHPYFRFRLARAIVNYRIQHGPFKHVEDLKNVVLLSDSIYQKILPYISLD